MAPPKPVPVTYMSILESLMSHGNLKGIKGKPKIHVFMSNVIITSAWN
jgi:hypothetical protein